MAQQDWKYVVAIGAEGSIELTGPYEDNDAATEFIDEFMPLAPEFTGATALSLQDPDEVIAALKKAAKKARKAEKKAAKAAAAEKGNGNGKGKKNKKGKKAAAATSPDEGEVDADPVTTEQGEQAESEAKAEAAYNGSLADDKQKLIESWSRAMTKHDVIGPLNLTPQQRRVIAALKWTREVNKSNAHMPGTVQPPAPIVGLDAKGRLVVQGLDGQGGFTGNVKQWAVLKNGDPTDISTPVERLKRNVAETV